MDSNWISGRFMGVPPHIRIPTHTIASTGGLQPSRVSHISNFVVLCFTLQRTAIAMSTLVGMHAYHAVCLISDSIKTINYFPSAFAHGSNLNLIRFHRRNWHTDVEIDGRHLVMAKAKKNPWLDPFDYGEDPDMGYGELYADGKQEEEYPRPPDNPDSEFGFLKFPRGYNVEIASLGSKLRGDVRKCCCLVAGGVYENLLFFPVIELLKERYPGVKIDVVANARGKQTYEINKNVRYATVYDLELQFVEPSVSTEMVGQLKNRYYDLMLSTRLAGIGHSSFMWLTSTRDRISYVYPNVNAAGSGLFLTESLKAPRLNLAEDGYDMYKELLDVLAKPGRNIPQQSVPPLKVSISRKLKEVVKSKYTHAGVKKGEFIVIHGIESDSAATMQSKGDEDSLLPVDIWAKLAKSLSGVKALFIIPHEKERAKVMEGIGEDSNIVFITTPGQLAAIINDSIGLVATNTAAIQLANALNKPSVAMFSSEAKANLFVPQAKEQKCSIIASETGKLADINIDAVKVSMRSAFEKSLVSA